jgi:hypothetical protein
MSSPPFVLHTLPISHTPWLITLIIFCQFWILNSLDNKQSYIIYVFKMKNRIPFCGLKCPREYNFKRSPVLQECLMWSPSHDFRSQVRSVGVKLLWQLMRISAYLPHPSRAEAADWQDSSSEAGRYHLRQRTKKKRVAGGWTTRIQTGSNTTEKSNASIGNLSLTL